MNPRQTQKDGSNTFQQCHSRGNVSIQRLLAVQAFRKLNVVSSSVSEKQSALWLGIGILSQTWFPFWGRNLVTIIQVFSFSDPNYGDSFRTKFGHHSGTHFGARNCVWQIARPAFWLYPSRGAATMRMRFALPFRFKARWPLHAPSVLQAHKKHVNTACFCKPRFVNCQYGQR